MEAIFWTAAASAPHGKPAQIWRMNEGARVQRAAMLAAILTGASPVGGNYPVATVAITGDGAGDQTVESPVVKILEGWV